MSVRAAIVGAGWMGGRHGTAIERSGDQVVAVIDPDLSRATSLAERFSARAYRDLREVDIVLDAGVVAGPTPTHLGSAMALLESRVGALIEKPHRIPGQDPSPLLQAEQDGAWVGIGMSFRFDAAIAAAVTAYREGHLGDLLEIDDQVSFHLETDSLPPWYFDPERSGGGILLTNGIHVLDRLCWIGQTRPVVDRAVLTRVFPTHRCDDHVVLHGTVAGIPFTSSLLWSQVPVGPPRIRLIGSHGVAVAEAGGAWTIRTADGATTHGRVADEDDMLEAQWRAFRARSEACPTPSEVDVAFEVIEEVYAHADVHGL